MSAPKKQADGFRYYNVWAGNPKGRKGDPARCAEEISPNERGGAAHCYQCTRKAVVGEFCRQHSPEAEAQRKAVAHARYTRVTRGWQRAALGREVIAAAMLWRLGTGTLDALGAAVDAYNATQEPE